MAKAAQQPDRATRRRRTDFWKTLPGLLTALASLIGALATLFVATPKVLEAFSPANAVVTGGGDLKQETAKADPTAPKERAATGQMHTTVGLLDTGMQPQSRQGYEVVRSTDGFLSLREFPNSKSAELARWPLGTVVRCGDRRLNAQGRPWRPCEDENGRQGFASDLYLQRIANPTSLGMSGEEHKYTVFGSSDGFLALREAPNIKSAELARWPLGTVVHCGKTQLNSEGRPWRRCSDAQGRHGFASDRFLRMVGDS